MGSPQHTANLRVPNMLQDMTHVNEVNRIRRNKVDVPQILDAEMHMRALARIDIDVSGSVNVPAPDMQHESATRSAGQRAGPQGP
jgi:hypothetical protein